jgi:hypothetical protein
MILTLLLILTSLCLLLHPAVQVYHDHLFFSAKAFENSNSEDAQDGQSICQGFESDIHALMPFLTMSPLGQVLRNAFPPFIPKQHSSILRC